ncbi:RNA-binding protein 20 [Apostichopus japonicus]|uniref:RNA-binding protein 20 n=1 Tax=Stichopus japonicus TaxID=307972 RepID=A0A2G8JHM2_STIJA|nr:RNA-binding protein 20 [Apostichopus japonicus]
MEGGMETLLGWKKTREAENAGWSIQVFISLCRAAMRETSSSLDIPEEEEETNKGGVIHPCNSCGRFYSKADGLQRHFESEEHRQRVLFLKERFGESWQQFRWYNQATESQNLNIPVGVAFVVPLSGFFCKLCSQFYNSEVSAKDVHCRQSSHIKKVKEWDRTSKGSMISLSLDANEIAAAVKKNDGGSSPPRSSKSSSQRRSPSSSRQGSHSSRDRQGKGSLERSSSSQREIKDIAKSKSGGIKIPGLDLDETKDLSDVSDEEESSIKSETRSTSRHPKSNVSEKSEDNIQKGDFKLEEGELSASEVRQLEKNQETARIVKEWETREKQRHWDREQRDLTKQREEEREKEQSKRDRERKERREREDRERKEREERERQRKEKREREKLEKERQDKEERDRKEKIQREKAEKERKEKRGRKGKRGRKKRKRGKRRRR